MKKFLKILAISVVGVLVILVGVAFWLFSSSGNAFLKDKITEIANQKAPIGLEFTHFDLGFNSYAFAITDKQKSQIALSGDYSLFSLNTKAKVNALIKDLALYEKLIGMRLNGDVSVNGDVIKESNKLAINADIKAFNSMIKADVSLEDFKPKRLFLSSKEGIYVESLLSFLNQPQYAKGRILINADMDISNLQAPSGGFNIASSAITPNTALLRKTYGLVLPKDSIKLAINGVAKNDSITTTLLATSSYLNVESNNLKASIVDFSSNGDIKVSVKNIGFSDFMLKTPLLANINLKSSNIANQEATLALNAVTNPILAHIVMPNYAPQSVKLNAKDLNLKELVQLASNYADMKDYAVNGSVSLNALVDKINLSPLNYTLKGDLKSTIASLQYQGLEIGKDNTLNAEISGNAKDLKVRVDSDLFDSKLLANAELESNVPQNVQVDIKGLNLQKLAKLLQYNAQGVLNAKADLTNFKDSNFDGDFSVESKQITLAKATLNKLSGMEFKKDLSFALEGLGKIKNGSGEAMLNVDGKDIQATIQNAKIDLKNNAYSADFALSTPEIANINPLSMALKGALSLKGSAGFANNKPSLILQNRDFGSFDVALKNEKLLVSGKDLDIKKIAAFTDNGKLIKGGVANLNADLSIKGDDAKTIIKHLNGSVELNTRNLEIYSIDIDALAKNYENTNSVNLLDVGAFVLAGPLGVAVTKGGDAGMLGLNAVVNSKSVIKELEAKFALKNGVAQAEDVAFATGKTRMAAVGAINLNNNAFENFSIGLLDEKDCAKYSQKVRGTLDNPKIEITQTAIKTAVNLASSIFKKLKKGAEVVTEPVLGEAKACVPFYHGSVKHPK
ncbi:AsmA-like C-terminal region-containing protein [Helicobacter turcicus]|uniref:Outer membrane protein n=1 Tax=Helicobacter turcicus TaxID=2867412 RepID=A0ABS7JMP5_9HELI|nr:AsmA-like C-terminal region-containing protein [Helicobacter turcicus]MBX7490668.1 hypothetical protein [Helicobacter turcicus]MBX7545424.1 hypothetical protein [Helicobacter turcicus]